MPNPLNNSNLIKLSLNDKLLASKHSTQIHSPKISKTQDNLTTNDINNTQPASISPTVFFLQRLVWVLELENRLTKEQCGFRRNHSTLKALSLIHNDICSALRSNQHLITIALDIKIANDAIWKNRVLSILHRWDLNGNILKCIENFLANSKFCVKINSHLSYPHDIVNELPQRSAFSVTFFLVAINDICKSLPAGEMHSF